MRLFTRLFLLPAVCMLAMFSCEQDADIAPVATAEAAASPTLTLKEAVQFETDGRFSYELTGQEVRNVLLTETGSVPDEAKEVAETFALLVGDRASEIALANNPKLAQNQNAKFITYAAQTQVIRASCFSCTQQLIAGNGLGGLIPGFSPSQVFSATATRSRSSSPAMFANAFLSSSGGSITSGSTDSSFDKHCNKLQPNFTGRARVNWSIGGPGATTTSAQVQCAGNKPVCCIIFEPAPCKTCLIP